MWGFILCVCSYSKSVSESLHVICSYPALHIQGSSIFLWRMYFWVLWVTFIIYISLGPSLSFFILTLCPSLLCALTPYSSHLAKVISCCVERDWHCDECTKQCSGREHKQQSSPEFTPCTKRRTQTELGMRKTHSEHKGGKKKQTKKTMVGLAGVDISHFSLSVYLCHLTLSLKHYKFSSP